MKKTYLTALLLVMGITLTACKSSMAPNKSSAITGETAVVENQLSSEILIVSAPDIGTEDSSTEGDTDAGASSVIGVAVHRIEEVTGGMKVDAGSQNPLPEDFGTIFLDVSGSSELSESLRTFLVDHNLSEKTIIPFGMISEADYESVLGTLYELIPDSEFLDGLSISTADTTDVLPVINEWLSGLGFND